MELHKSEEMVEFGGLGHSAVIHTPNHEVQDQFGLKYESRSYHCKCTINTWWNW